MSGGAFSGGTSVGLPGGISGLSLLMRSRTPGLVQETANLLIRGLSEVTVKIANGVEWRRYVQTYDLVHNVLYPPYGFR